MIKTALFQRRTETRLVLKLKVEQIKGSEVGMIDIHYERSVANYNTPVSIPSVVLHVCGSEKFMKISASIRNTSTRHEAIVSTGESAQSINVPLKSSGRGSSVNGGEFLLLALATCYCNDLYREAARLGISIESVEVEVSAEFPGIGLAASNITYRAQVSSPAAPQEIAELMRVTDAVAEIHNTVRAGVPVTLEQP